MMEKKTATHLSVAAAWHKAKFTQRKNPYCERLQVATSVWKISDIFSPLSGPVQIPMQIPLKLERNENDREERTDGRP